MKITKENLQVYLKSQGYDVTPEFRFCKERMFRSDFKVCKGDKCCLVEYEGVDPKSGFWTNHNGRKLFVYPSNGHTAPINYTKDCEKYNLAGICGYHVFRYTVLNLNDILSDLHLFFNC